MCQRQGGLGSVRLRFGKGPVQAVPVFGSGGSSAKRVFCVSVQFNRKERFRFRFRFLETVPAVPVPLSFGFGKTVPTVPVSGSSSVPELPCKESSANPSWQHAAAAGGSFREVRFFWACGCMLLWVPLVVDGLWMQKGYAVQPGRAGVGCAWLGERRHSQKGVNAPLHRRLTKLLFAEG